MLRACARLQVIIFGFCILQALSPQALAVQKCGPPLTGKVHQQWDDRLLRENSVDFNDDLKFAAEIRRSDTYGVVDTFYSQRFGTRFYYSSLVPRIPGEAPTLVSPEASRVVIFLHGSGTVKSSGKNFIENMNRLASYGVASFSLDLPFHEDGPISENLYKLDNFMNWIHGIVQEAKKSGKPVYLSGHSFGPDVIWEYLYRYPNSVDGALMLSPAAYDNVLRAWYENFTSKMIFGGDVQSRELGSTWSESISNQIHNLKQQRRPDPTVVNPKLALRILWGAQEEYIPAPIGGPTRTPIGDNTYDVKPTLRSFFKNAVLIQEPGIGHYLFQHTDKDGWNVIDREFAALFGLAPQDLIQTTRIKDLANTPAGQRLLIRLSYDRLLTSYLEWKFSPKFFRQLKAGKIPDANVERIMAQYDRDKLRRYESLAVDILASENANPTFYKNNYDKIQRIKAGEYEPSTVTRLYLDLKGGR